MKGKLITLALMIVIVILILSASAAYALMTVRINNTVYSNQNSLEDAVRESGLPLSGITSIDIVDGSAMDADWAYISNNKDSLTRLNRLSATGYDDLPESFLSGNNSIQSVDIFGVVGVGGSAFSNCGALESVSFPKATNIDMNTFGSCSVLKTVNLPSATDIENLAFGNCEALTNISLPKAITINLKAFLDCDKLETASFPAVERIDYGVFDGCTALNSLALPQNPPVVGENAFYNCPEERSLKLVDGNGNALTKAALNDAIDNYKNDDAGYDADTGKWWGWTLPERVTIKVEIDDAEYEGVDVESAVAKSGVALQAIDSIRFTAGDIEALNWDYINKNRSSLTTLTTLTVAQSVTTAANLPDEFLFNVRSLQSVDMAHVEGIGANAFLFCSALNSASFPAAKDIADKAFYGCNALSSLSLSAKPPTVGSQAFDGCPESRNLTIVDAAGNQLVGVELNNAIDEYDGGDGDGKWEGWTLPERAAMTIFVKVNGVEYADITLQGAIAAAIADEANPTAASLASITSVEVTSGVVTAGDWDYIKNNNGSLTGLATLIVTDKVTSAAHLPDNFLIKNLSENRSIKTVSIDKVTEIGAFAFYKCLKLKSVSFPAATKLDNTALGYCFDIIEANFPSVTDIGDYALASWILMESVSFPKAAKIGSEAFMGCSALKSLSLPAKPPVFTGGNWFSNCPPSRNLTLVDADGEPLEGVALIKAIDAYEADNGYDQDTKLWQGWAIQGMILGDAYDDGKINNRDVVTILRWSAVTPSDQTDDMFARGDVNEDGKVNEADARALIDIVAGKP